MTPEEAQAKVRDVAMSLPPSDFGSHRAIVACAELLLELAAERDEADRRVGAAERKMSRLIEDANARKQWLYDAKRDDVWRDALAALIASRSEEVSK